MPIIALSRRLFPTTPRRRRISAGGSLGDSEQESTEATAAELAPGRDALSDQGSPEQRLDALFEMLDDEELAHLAEMETEDLEAWIEELQKETGAPRRRRNLINVAV